MSNNSDDPYEVVEAPNFDALGFLQSIYNDASEPKSLRMRAAIEALPFERPKLAVTATLSSDDFALRLERAAGRSGKVIEGSVAHNVNDFRRRF
jgi:hypothetical protein